MLKNGREERRREMKQKENNDRRGRKDRRD